MGTLRGLYISDDHAFRGHKKNEPGPSKMLSKELLQCDAGKGLVGDRYYNHKPDFKGQVTFFDWSIYESLKNDFNSQLTPGDMRRNLLVEDIYVTDLIGKRFFVGEVEFEGTEHCSPCYWMDQAIGKGACQWMLENKGGLRAKVLNSGIIRIGDLLHEATNNIKKV